MHARSYNVHYRGGRTREELDERPRHGAGAGRLGRRGPGGQRRGPRRRCQSGEFCYYYNSNNHGSISDFTGSVGDYGTTQPSCYEYKGPGNGQGMCIKNDAASVWNRTGKKVRVYYNSNYDGSRHYQDFAPGAKKNLYATMKNNNASHKIGSRRRLHDRRHEHDAAQQHPRVPRRRWARRPGSFKQYFKKCYPTSRSPPGPASLRAGAMAVKSYGWYWALHSTRTSPRVRATTARRPRRSGVRAGVGDKPDPRAVAATWGTRLTRNGSILQAHYCSTCTRPPAWETGNWMSPYGPVTSLSRHSWQANLRTPTAHLPVGRLGTAVAHGTGPPVASCATGGPVPRPTGSAPRATTAEAR